MRTQSLIRHEQWSVLVQLWFSREVGLAGVMAKVHHIEADEVKWGSGPNHGIGLSLLRHGEKGVSFSAHFLTRVRFLALPPPGSRTHARWVPGEDERLRGELEQDTPLAWIARILGRSEGAVHSRLAAVPSLAAVQGRIPYPRTKP